MYKFFIGVITTLLLGIFTALGLSLSGLIPIAATSKEPAPVAWFLHTTYEKAVQRNAANISVPPDFNSENNILRGARNFSAMCASCHTAPGKQATAVSLGLNPPPPKAVELASELTSAERFWVISNGVKMTGMPAFGPEHKDANELWALVAFTEKLPSLNAVSYEAMIVEARKQRPAGDGHNHSHAGENSADKKQPASHHSSTSMELGNKPDHHAPTAPDMMNTSEPPKPAEHDHSSHSH